MPKKLSNYDQYGYDYAQYWDNRDYEDEAEKILLERLFKGHKGKRIIDIGGSFGRLLPVYAAKYDEVVIIDYSIETLKKYAPQIREKYPNVTLIAANAYHLPFKSSSFDAGLMVRVLHHIEKPGDYFAEIARILSPNAIYIQEFANKVHIKARLKWTLQGKLGMLNQEPYQQPSQGSLEGSKEEALFLNFHPRHIRKLLLLNSLDIVSKSNCSFLRMNLLKRRFSTSTLIKIEQVLQKLLGWSNIAPSVVYEAKLHSDSQVTSPSFKTLSETIACPKCRRSLEKVSKTQMRCAECNRDYVSDHGIYDMRIN